jgi:flagellar protein FliJ
MPKFTFKLAGVLEHRKQIERQRQRELAVAQQKVLGVQAEIDALNAVKRSSSDHLRTGRLTAASLAAHQRFAAAMRQKASALARQLDHARHEVEGAQLTLLEAAKQRKMMEKLRERELARWTEAQQRRESAEADDVARQMHQHRSTW